MVQCCYSHFLGGFALSAKEMFESLGYTQKVYDTSDNKYEHGIQYTRIEEVTSMTYTKVIEFYFEHQEMLMMETVVFRDGTSKKSDIVLSFDEFLAVQQQIVELGFKSKQAT
jgi:hypothetical protein